MAKPKMIDLALQGGGSTLDIEAIYLKWKDDNQF
jgi:hypothetical protein